MADGPPIGPDGEPLPPGDFGPGGPPIGPDGEPLADGPPIGPDGEPLPPGISVQVVLHQNKTQQLEKLLKLH